jgi:cellulose synthase (UDP-forming)
VGILLFYTAGHLPEDGMWANVFWASVNASLALLVVRFTRRQADNRRDEYRFQLPVAARLAGALGTVDDLSPKGMSFYGALGEPVIGARLPLVLYLPDGPLNTGFEIRSAIPAEHGGVQYTRLIGGSFVDLPLAEEQRIEQFLYGTNIQWELNRYQEDSLTPMQRLGWVPQVATSTAARYWASCEIVRQDGQLPDQIGLVGSLHTQHEVELLVSQKLDTARQYALVVHSRLGTHTLLARAEQFDPLSSGGGTLFRYRMRLEEAAAIEPAVTAAALAA